MTQLKLFPDKPKPDKLAKELMRDTYSKLTGVKLVKKGRRYFKIY